MNLTNLLRQVGLGANAAVEVIESFFGLKYLVEMADLKSKLLSHLPRTQMNPSYALPLRSRKVMVSYRYYAPSFFVREISWLAAAVALIASDIR